MAQLISNDPTVGKFVWELPEELASALEQVRNDEELEKFLSKSRTLIEGLLAIIVSSLFDKDRNPPGFLTRFGNEFAEISTKMLDEQTD